MPNAPRLSDTALCLVDAIWRTMHTPAWSHALADTEARMLLLLLGICEELHPRGRVAFPSTAEIEGALHRYARDVSIRQEFKGNNHIALAQKFHISPRQIRRILAAGKE